MNIKIVNGVPVGTIKVHNTLNSNVIGPEKRIDFKHCKYLYNFSFLIWYDFAENKVYFRMYGSIISMMQFRKFLLMNSLILSE